VILIATTLITSSFCYPQWIAIYGGKGDDRAYSIQQTSNGGYIVAGTTESFGKKNHDLWILKLNPNGAIAWQKTYGGNGYDQARSIQQTSDGGYIVAGTTESFCKKNHDLWILKLKGDGTVVWQKSYGGQYKDDARFIHQTADHGYVVTGNTWSFSKGKSDVWVLKLKFDGSIDWQKSYGGNGYDKACSIYQTSDGGYVITGITKSFGAQDHDFWVLKLRSNGTIIWQKAFGGFHTDYGRSIQQTRDMSYVVAGWTRSFGGGDYDGWVLKLNPDGNIVWQKTYGGSGSDHANFIQQTDDGGYIVTGWTDSFGKKNLDLWIFKLNPNGKIVWQKTYGGNDIDYAESVMQTSDGGYIIAGGTMSFGFTRKAGFNSWVLKLDANGEIHDCDVMGISEVFVSDTSVTAKNTNAIPQDTFSKPIDTSVIPQVIETEISLLCRSPLQPES